MPQSGVRVLVASDGVWDAFEKMLRVCRMARSWSVEVSTAAFASPDPATGVVGCYEPSFHVFKSKDTAAYAIGSACKVTSSSLRGCRCM